MHLHIALIVRTRTEETHMHHIHDVWLNPQVWTLCRYSLKMTSDSRRTSASQLPPLNRQPYPAAGAVLLDNQNMLYLAVQLQAIQLTSCSYQIWPCGQYLKPCVWGLADAPAEARDTGRVQYPEVQRASSSRRTTQNDSFYSPLQASRRSTAEALPVQANAGTHLHHCTFNC